MKIKPNNNIAIDCYSKEEYIKVLEIFEKEGLKWIGNEAPTRFIRFWDESRETMTLCYEDHFTYVSNDTKYCPSHGCKSITAKQFIKMKTEEEYQNVMDIKKGDTVKCVSKANVTKFAGDNGMGWEANLEFVVTSLSAYSDHNIYFGGKNAHGVYSDAVRLVKRKDESILPEKWYIRTENMTKEIKEWFCITASYSFTFGLSYYGNYSTIRSLSSYGGIIDDKIHLGTEISAKQFNKYILKQKPITNIINNMKQEFTIEGSLPLQEAFVKECNIPYSKTAGSIEKGFNDFPYLCPSSYSKEFTSNTDKQSVHFSLPTQWEEAKDYALDFFKEEDKIVIDGYEAEVEKGKIAFGCNKFALADLQAIKRVISIANTLEYTLLIDGKKAQVEDDDDKVMDIPTIDTLINMLKK